MSKRMTVVFDDEGLYTALKVAAVRSGQHAKDIVAQAVRDWLQAREDEELQAGLAEARQEWERDGGRDAGEFFAELDEATDALSRGVGSCRATGASAAHSRRRLAGELARNPRPVGSRKLRGSLQTWRIRVGPYRVVYDIHTDTC